MTLFLLGILALLCTFNISHARQCDVAIVGAAAGGVYSAYRLVENEFEGTICIYEATERIGGRIFSLTKKEIPEFEAEWYVELGGYRWNDQFTYMEHKIITELLNLPWRCYDQNGVNPTQNCPGIVPFLGPWHFREHWILGPDQSQATANPANWPYFFTSPNFEGAFPGSVGGFIDTLPFLNFADITNPDPSIRWPAVESAIQQLKTYVVPFDYSGNPLNVTAGEISQWTWFGNNKSDEWQAANRDLSATSDPAFDASFNLYNYASRNIKFTAEGSELGTDGFYRVIDAGDGRFGYVTWIEKLLEKAQRLRAQQKKKPIQLYFNQWLNRIDKDFSLGDTEDAKRYTLGFKDTSDIRTATAKSVILNIQKENFDQLESDGVTYTARSEGGSKMINSFKQVGGAKVYLLYEKAWWLENGWFSGAIKTTKWIREIRYHDGQATCNKGFTNCRGLLFSGYIIDTNLWNYEENHIIQTEPGKPYTVFRADTPQGHDFIQNIHEMVLDAHQLTVDPATVPFPTLAVLSVFGTDKDPVYRACGTILQPTDFSPSNNFSQYIINPFENERIYIADSDFSSWNGFAEVSIRMAEKIIRKHYGGQRPWYLEPFWYHANIDFNE